MGDDPPWPCVMFTTKNFDLAPTGAHSLDESVRLVGFATCFAHFRHNDVRIQTAVDPRWELKVAVAIAVSFYADEHVFLSMVEPVARSACTDDALKLLTIWNVLSDGWT
jgi:hypothetical protein